MTTTVVLQALQAATAGTGLRVLPCPELGGASLLGERAEGYVFPGTGGWWQLELWRREALNPYRIHRAPTLDAAINTAVDALRRAGPHRSHPRSIKETTCPTSDASTRDDGRST